MTKSFHIYLKVFLFCLPTFIVFQSVAQDQHSEEVNIVGSFKPKISKADKMNFYPKINNESIQLPQLRYDFKSSIFESWFDLEPVKPARIGKELSPLLMRNYIRGAYGNNNTPYAEFFASTIQQKEYAFGLHLKHLSSDGNIKDRAKSSFSKNQVDVFGTYIFKTHQLSAKAFYERNMLHKYGFRPIDYMDLYIDSNIHKQRFQEAGMEFHLNSNYLNESKLYHTIDIGYAYFGDINQTKEHHLNFDLKLKQQIKSDVNNQLSLGLNASVDYYKIKMNTVDKNETYTVLNPFIRADFNEYYIKVGFNTYFKTDSTTKNHLYPNIEAGIKIIPNVLNAKMGILGEYGRNGFASLSKINPYVKSELLLKDFNSKFKVYGQIEGKLSENLDMKISLSQSSIDNYAFFVIDTQSEFRNEFKVVYDDVDFLQAKFALNYEAKEQIHLNFDFTYNNYTLTNEVRAWHKPQFSIGIGGRFALTDKVVLKTRLNAAGKSYAQSYSGDTLEVKELDPYVDFNAELEYHHTDHLSFFISGNNLLGSSYQKWNNYPNQNLTILGGVSYAF